MASSPLSQYLHNLFESSSIHASEMNLVVDNAICPSQEFVDEVLHLPDDSSASCSLDDSFSSIHEQDNKILSPGGEDDSGVSRWETTARVTKKTLSPPCKCTTPSSKTSLKMPKRRLSEGAISNWMLQMPTDGLGDAFNKMNAADIVKEAEYVVAPTNHVVSKPRRINKIVSKSA
jgi:hypothetical protein